MSAEHNLQRFVRAQDPVYRDAIRMLRHGVMCTPYMEFIFPRLFLRRSGATPEHYAIASLDEAGAYLSCPILGGRYRECVGILQRLANASAHAVFGDADAQKLHASLTLFSEAGGDEFLLESMFYAWFDGLLHEETMSQIYLTSR
jgi:uncharacterized protein (DUF1810 family)